MSTLKSAQRFAAAPQVQLVHKGLLLDHATSKTLTTYSLPHTHTDTHSHNNAGSSHNNGLNK